MVCKKFSLLEIFAVSLVGLLLTAGFLSVEVQPHWDADLSYKLLPPILDPERRTEQLGDTWRDESLDLAAFVGMPDAYRDLVAEYVQTVCSEIGVQPLKRKRYYHRDRSMAPGRDHYYEFPDDFNPVYDREIVVPLSVLPRPEIVSKWSDSSDARTIGWRSMDSVFEHGGSVYGRTLIFEPGRLSKEPNSLPAIPLGSKTVCSGDYARELSCNVDFFWPLGKIVLDPFFNGTGSTFSDYSADLRLGEKGGAKLLGELTTVPAFLQNTRLRWVSYRNGINVRQFLAYSLVDGNGANRVKRPNQFQNLGVGVLSPYVRPLTCELHQPRIKQHDLLLLPSPLGWRRAEEANHQERGEIWCMDDWFPSQTDACWVIRETADSKPLQESFALMPASEKSDLPVFFIALFAETAPKQLVIELATLYQVSAEATLNSPESMQRLDSLYEKVRDFQFEAKDKDEPLRKDH